MTTLRYRPELYLTCEQDELTTTVAPTIVANPVPLYSGYPPDFAPRLIALFERIQRRGSEPLFPSSWQLDFLGLPENLFLSEFSDPSYAAIRSMSGDKSSEFRGKLAIERMLLVGRAVRDRMDLNELYRTDAQQLPVEALIKKELDRLLQWTCADAEVEQEQLSLFIAVSTRNKSPTKESSEDYDQLTAKMTKRLTRLARSHRDAVEKLVTHDQYATMRSKDKGIQALGNLESYRIERARSTTVYGICICGPLMVIVALNTRDPEFPIRTLLTIDYADADQDLWNTLSVVLTIMTAKEECLDCSHAKEIRAEHDLASEFSHMRVKAASSNDVDA